MKKATIFVLSIFCFVSNATAQQSSSATQTVKLILEPVIHITAITSTNVNLTFDDVTKYASGVSSTEQKFKIQSNKDFVVSVKTDASTFSYAGNSYPAPTMPVENTLFLEVTENNTGGSVNSPFNSFSSLSNTPKSLIVNGKNGGDKVFAVNYKANPSNNYPAGEYTVGIVYTATQP